MIIEITLFVVLRLYVGALVVLLPWRSVWTTNAWINNWPTIASFMAQGWVRGIVSGLGLLNIWIAFSVLFNVISPPIPSMPIHCLLPSNPLRSPTRTPPSAPGRPPDPHHV